MTFAIAFILHDPIRNEVRKSIENLLRTEVTVRMLSGDNLQTAIHCAKKTGILRDNEENNPFACMSGDQFV